MKNTRQYLCILILNVLLIGPQYSQENIFFQDYFYNNDNDWALRDTKKMLLKVEAGKYVMEHRRDKGSWLTWQSKTLDQYQDFQIEFALRHINGVNNMGFGFIWGSKDSDNYYTFNITNNGYYRYSKNENENWVNIIKWTKNSSILPDNKTNNIIIKKKGSRYYFYANNNLLQSANFEPFLGNRFGFVLWYKQRIEIDHLIIKQPIQDNLAQDLIFEDLQNLDIPTTTRVQKNKTLRKNKYKTAVVEFSELGQLNIPDAGKIVSDWLSTALNNTNVFDVYERISMSQLMEEHKFELSGLVEEQTMAEIGKIHGVDAIITGNVSKFGNLISVNVKLIDVETAKILDSSTITTAKIDDIPSLIDKLAMDLATE